MGSRASGKARTKPKGKAPTVAARRACFLDALRQTANVSSAARIAGLASSTVYRHRANNANFAAAWDAAIAEAMDELEDVLIQRAKHGVEKPIYFRGEQVGTVRSYSDALGMFLLKARRPEIYSRMQAPASLADMTQDEARAEVERRLDRLGGTDDGDAQA